MLTRARTNARASVQADVEWARQREPVNEYNKNEISYVLLLHACSGSMTYLCFSYIYISNMVRTQTMSGESLHLRGLASLGVIWCFRRAEKTQIDRIWLAACRRKANFVRFLALPL